LARCSDAAQARRVQQNQCQSESGRAAVPGVADLGARRVGSADAERTAALRRAASGPRLRKRRPARLRRARKFQVWPRGRSSKTQSPGHERYANEGASTNVGWSGSRGFSRLLCRSPLSEHRRLSRPGTCRWGRRVVGDRARPGAAPDRCSGIQHQVLDEVRHLHDRQATGGRLALYMPRWDAGDRRQLGNARSQAVGSGCRWSVLPRRRPGVRSLSDGSPAEAPGPALVLLVTRRLRVVHHAHFP